MPEITKPLLAKKRTRRRNVFQCAVVVCFWIVNCCGYEMTIINIDDPKPNVACLSLFLPQYLYCLFNNTFHILHSTPMLFNPFIFGEY